MTTKFRVAVVVGSLRSGSISRKVANALMARVPPTLSCHVVEIADLPLYNQDLDERPPAAWTLFRQEVADCDAILFVTPEYNRSVPGCLKNALDVGSRPEGENVFAGMPAGVVSVTPYKLGAFGANHALRQTFVFLDMPVMQQPEAYLGGAAELFDDRDELVSDEVSALLKAFGERFAEWVAAVCKRRGDMDSFLKGQREDAARAYVDGDVNPLNTLLTHEDPATFFPPTGGVVRGAADVAQRYAADAASFSNGGTSRLEVLQSSGDGSLAFWTGYQHASAKMKDADVPHDMTLRVTEVFRSEAGEWKLVHRHADIAKPDEKPG
jgi:NAD(P)H-dependent FMN reductase/ketosteroid isomerase-like protein